MKTFLSCLAFAGTISLYSQNTLAEHHFEASDITSVQVEGSFCDVYVSRGERLIFDGIIQGKGDRGDYVISSIRNGDLVIFRVEKSRKNNVGWNLEKARFDIELPKGVNLIIDNSSGDVTVREYENEQLEVKATSGDLVLTGIKSASRLETTSGDLVVRGSSGAIRARSTSGDQEYEELSGDLQTTSTSGDIEIDELIGSLDAESTSGDIELSRINGTITARSTSGNIDGNAIELKGDSFFRTSSGDIKIDLINDLEEIGFDLTASSGDLQVGRMEGDDRLIIKRGSIRVKGESSSGDQRYTN